MFKLSAWERAVPPTPHDERWVRNWANQERGLWFVQETFNPHSGCLCSVLTIYQKNCLSGSFSSRIYGDAWMVMFLNSCAFLSKAHTLANKLWMLSQCSCNFSLLTFASQPQLVTCYQQLKFWQQGNISREIPDFCLSCGWTFLIYCVCLVHCLIPIPGLLLSPFFYACLKSITSPVTNCD